MLIYSKDIHEVWWFRFKVYSYLCSSIDFRPYIYLVRSEHKTHCWADNLAFTDNTNTLYLWFKYVAIKHTLNFQIKIIWLQIWEMHLTKYGEPLGQNSTWVTFGKSALSTSLSFLPSPSYCFFSTINATYKGLCELFRWLFARTPLKPSLYDLLKTGCRPPEHPAPTIHHPALPHCLLTSAISFLFIFCLQNIAFEALCGKALSSFLSSDCQSPWGGGLILGL